MLSACAASCAQQQSGRRLGWISSTTSAVGTAVDATADAANTAVAATGNAAGTAKAATANAAGTAADATANAAGTAADAVFGRRLRGARKLGYGLFD